MRSNLSARAGYRLAHRARIDPSAWCGGALVGRRGASPQMASPGEGFMWIDSHC